MRLSEVRERILEADRQNYDRYHTARQISFQDWDTVLIDHHPFEVAPSAKRLLSVKLGVPAPYMDRCPPDLQQTNLNHWLGKLPDHKPLFCRFTGSTLRGVFTDRYHPLDHKDVITQIDIPGDTDVRFRMNDEMMNLSVPDEGRRFSVVPGDEMVPDLCVTNSEVGLKAFSIEAYFLRLVCTNGMVAAEAVQKKFRHVSIKGVEGFHEAIHLLQEETHRLKGSMAVAVNQAVPDPKHLIESLGRQLVIPKKEVELVQSHYQGPETMWGVINAWTAAAKDTSLTLDRQYALEKAGGAVLHMCRR